MLSRRHALLGGAALVSAVAARPAAASADQRELALYHAGRRIGAQTVAVTPTPSGLAASLEIDIAVRLFGMTMYRYRMAAREVWADGRLEALEASTDDNGTARFARGARRGETFAIEGSGFTGEVAGNPATASYWCPDFLGRGIWISLEDGRPRRVSATEIGRERIEAEGGALEATRWRIGGEIDPIDLFYDAAGEWVGNEFRARGQTARFVLADRGPALTALWQRA